MSVKPWAGVALTCDACGQGFEWDDAMVALPVGQEDELLDLARDSDWTIFADDFAVCYTCAPPSCTCGHLWGDHEYDEASGCTEESCACERWERDPLRYGAGVDARVGNPTP